MPKKVTLDDGSEIEVLTDEEKKELQDNAAKAETLGKEIAGLNTQIKDLEEGSNPDWPSVRAKIKDKEKLEAAMKADGYSLGDDGKIIKAEGGDIKPGDIDKTATAAAQKVIYDNHKASKLAQFDDETRAVIEKNYDLLAAGQTFESVAGVDAILDNAIKIGAPTHIPVDPSLQSGLHGGPPVLTGKNETTPGQVELGKDLGVSQEDMESTTSIESELLSNKRE